MAQRSVPAKEYFGLREEEEVTTLLLEIGHNNLFGKKA
jgi:hypothetical protein